MVRRTIHPILRHLSPRDDLQVPQPFAQRSDLRALLLVPLKHERVLVRRPPRVPRLKQRLQPRVEPRERASLPFLRFRERLEVQLLVSRLLRLAPALFLCEPLLLVLPSLRLLFLLHHKREVEGQGQRGEDRGVGDGRQQTDAQTKEKKDTLLASVSAPESRLD